MTKQDDAVSGFKQGFGGAMGIMLAIIFVVLAFGGLSCAGCLGLAAIGASQQGAQE